MLLANSLAKSSRDFLLSWFPSLSESSDSSQELNGTHFFASSKLHYPNTVLTVSIYQYQCLNQGYCQSNQIPLTRWWWWWWLVGLEQHSPHQSQGKTGIRSLPQSEYLVKLAVNGSQFLSVSAQLTQRWWCGIIHPILQSGGSCICCLASRPLPSQCKARYKIFYNSIFKTQNIFPVLSSL